MDIIFLVYGLAFLAMGLTIVLRRERRSRLELSGILWLLAAFGFTHGFLEWTDLWRVVRGDTPGLAAIRPAILLLSYLFLFEFGRRLVLTSLSAVAREKPASRLLSAWIYTPLLGGIIAGMAVSDQPALAMAIGSRYLVGFFGSALAGVGFFLYWRTRLEPTMATLDRRVIRISSQVAAGAFIAYAILGGLVVPRADWFPASVINQETFLATFHVPVQLLRAACAVLAAISVGVLLRIFHLEGVRQLQVAFHVAQQALADLRKLSHQNELILNSAAEGIFGTDIDGKLVFINDAALSMLNFQREELVGHEIHPLIHHTTLGGKPRAINDFPVHQTILDHAIRRVNDDIFWRKDGSNFPVIYVAAPLLDEGRVIGAVVAFMDTTERKMAEMALLKLNETLEQRVQEETAKNLAQEHLLIQQSRHAAMGEMIGNIAHQWRQPLSSLGLIIQNIALDYQEGLLDQNSLNEYEKNAMNSVHMMSNMIDDFRKFFQPSRVEETFSLLKPIHEALSLIDASLKNNAITVTVDCPESLAVSGLPNEFSRVMLNLLANAKDALLEKNISVKKIEILAYEAGNITIVCVRDNGGGVPAKMMDKIFDPYFTSKESGTGIGLYMTRVIVEQHMHGQITCRNIEGGAEFMLSFPRETRQV